MEERVRLRQMVISGMKSYRNRHGETANARKAMNDSQNRFLGRDVEMEKCMEQGTMVREQELEIFRPVEKAEI